MLSAVETEGLEEEQPMGFFLEQNEEKSWYKEFDFVERCAQRGGESLPILTFCQLVPESDRDCNVTWMAVTRYSRIASTLEDHEQEFDSIL